MVTEIGLARLNKDGSVTIPWSIRRKYKAGERLVVLADEKRITLKRAGSVQGALLQMVQEPKTNGGIRKAGKAPVKMPKRDKMGRFLPARPTSRK